MTPKLTVLATRRIDSSTADSSTLEDPRGHGPVDVAVLGEGPAQGRVVGIMGEDPQLDLRVVGRQAAASPAGPR